MALSSARSGKGTYLGTKYGKPQKADSLTYAALDNKNIRDVLL